LTLPLHNLCSLFLLVANCCAISSLSRMYSRPLSPADPLSLTLTLSLERQPLALHSRLGGKPPTVPGPCQSVQGASRQRHTLLHQACLGQDAEVHSPWRRPVRGPARDGGERGARGAEGRWLRTCLAGGLGTRGEAGEDGRGQDRESGWLREAKKGWTRGAGAMRGRGEGDERM
jgi:hypothetical protein